MRLVVKIFDHLLLLARLTGQYCFTRCRRRLSSSVTRVAVGRRRAGRVAGPAADIARLDSTVTSR